MHVLLPLASLLGLSLPGLQENRDVPVLPPTQGFEDHENASGAPVFNPTGLLFLSATRDRRITLWDLEGPRVIRTFTGHDDKIRDVTLSGDGRQALSGGEEGNVLLWEAGTGKLVRSFQGPKRLVHSVSVSPDGRLAAAGYEGDTVCVWELATGRLLLTLNDNPRRVFVVTFSRTGNRLLIGGEADARHGKRNTVVVRDSRTGAWVCDVETRQISVYSLSLSPDGRSALASGFAATVVHFEIETGNLLRTLKSPELVEGGHSCVAFCPDGRFAVSSSSFQKAILWDLETGQEVRHLTQERGWAMAITFNPSGSKILARTSYDSLLLWEPGRAKRPAAREWAAQLGSQNAGERKRLQGQVLSDLAGREFDRWGEARERLLALGDDGIRLVVEAYPPDDSRPIADRVLDKLRERLDSDDPETRDLAEKELEKGGRRTLDWVGRQLALGDKIPSDLRIRLEKFQSEMESPSLGIPDRGRVRAMLFLIDALPRPAAEAALKRYAESIERGYAAEVARRAIR